MKNRITYRRVTKPSLLHIAFVKFYFQHLISHNFTGRLVEAALIAKIVSTNFVSLKLIIVSLCARYVRFTLKLPPFLSSHLNIFPSFPKNFSSVVTKVLTFSRKVYSKLELFKISCQINHAQLSSLIYIKFYVKAICSKCICWLKLQILFAQWFVDTHILNAWIFFRYLNTWILQPADTNWLVNKKFYPQYRKFISCNLFYCTLKLVLINNCVT